MRQRGRSVEEIERRTELWRGTRSRVVLPTDRQPSLPVTPSLPSQACTPTNEHCYSLHVTSQIDARTRSIHNRSSTRLIADLEEENRSLKRKLEILSTNLEKEKESNSSLLMELRDLTLRNETTIAELDVVRLSQSESNRSRSKRRVSDTPWMHLDYRTRGKYRQQAVAVLKPLASRKDGSIAEADLRTILTEIWKLICPTSSLFPHLTPSQDLEMMKLTGMTWEDREELQRFLNQHDCNILSPYNQVWTLNRQHISSTNEYYENGELPLEHKGKDGEKLVGPSGYCRVRREKLIELIVHECERHERSGCMDYTGRFDGEIWIAYMSDKGADSTKAGLAIINTKHANSPFFVIPFATWYGEECYSNQELVIGELMKDLGKIKQINVMNTERNVLLHGVSDFSARNVLLGQKGPSHSNPCTECEYEKAAGRAPISTRMRTEERRKECLELYERLVEEGEKEEDAARASKGICKPPIVPISPSNFCVASVHLATGPGARALSLVESTALSLDLANAGCTSKLEEMKDRKEMEAKFQGSIDSAISLSKAASLEVDDCGRLLIALSQNKSNSDGECAASYCVKGNLTRGSGKLRRKSVWNTDTCSVCKRGFHFVCSLTLSSESENAKKMSCPSCKGWTRDSYATQVKLQLEFLKKNLWEKEKYANHATSDNRKLIEIVRGKGHYFSQVKLFLASKGVSRSNWFQAYSGREVREALKDENVGLLFGIIGMEKKGDLWDALISIRNILSLAKPAFLSEDEMESLKDSVTLFSSSYRSLFRKADQSVKVHYISSHLLTYATLYNTIGLVSEQSIEHFHALFNRYQRQFRSLASPGKKLQRIMCEHLIISRLVLVYDYIENSCTIINSSLI